MTDTEPDGWSAAALLALRKKAGLTQQQLADAAGFDRTTIVHLEKNRRAMSPYYASVLAKPLKVKPEDLLPPAAPVTGPKHPFALLTQLSEAVGNQQVTIEVLERKVEALERGDGKRRPASGGR